MTPEEKAQAYDELLVKAKQIYNKENDVLILHTIEDLFPELKESEDEKIRKAIVEVVKRFQERDKWIAIQSISFDKIYAWLEKQGGQKSTDKVEPKFHEGDWVVSNLDGKARQISKVHFDEYNSYYAVDGKAVNLEEYDRLHHLWTIQDAKNGDVLIDKSHIGEYVFIFKEARPSDIKTDVKNPLAIIGYCGINHIGFTSQLSGIGFGDTANCTYYPATKEQRDLLFQKMKEAGYEWNAEKKELKELKKIERKPADKAEPKFKGGDWVVDKNGIVHQILSYKNGIYKHTNGYSAKIFEDRWRIWDITKDAKDGDVLAEDSCIFIIQKLGDNSTAAKTYCTLYDDGDFDDGAILYFDINSTKPATKKQRDLLFEKMYGAGYMWDSEKKELKKVEQKPTWSEEDNKTFLELDTIIYQNTSSEDYDRLYNWLKSIKPQQKQEWSEEDENLLNRLIGVLDGTNKEDYHEAWEEKFLPWLKSLKDRVLPRPKQEWSKEDERIRKELLEHCINRSDGKQVCVDASDYKRWADWLFKIGNENIPNVKRNE